MSLCWETHDMSRFMIHSRSGMLDDLQNIPQMLGESDTGICTARDHGVCHQRRFWSVHSGRGKTGELPSDPDNACWLFGRKLKF